MSPQRLRDFLQHFSRKLVSLLSGVTSSHAPVSEEEGLLLTHSELLQHFLGVLIVPPHPRLSDFHLAYLFILNPTSFILLLS